jgi:predicted N-formylglutamate amidohydrolase
VPSGGATVFTNLFSRLVVDPERFPDDREVMREVGMGAVYIRTSSLMPLRSPDSALEAGLLRRYFFPYADAIREPSEYLDESAARIVSALSSLVRRINSVATPLPIG